MPVLKKALDLSGITSTGSKQCLVERCEAFTNAECSSRILAVKGRMVLGFFGDSRLWRGLGCGRDLSEELGDWRHDGSRIKSLITV